MPAGAADLVMQARAGPETDSQARECWRGVCSIRVFAGRGG
jgi:hypothetical protein